MKKLGLFAAALVLPALSEGASCCIGGSPKSFIELQRLENHEIGLSASYRDVYGYYNVYGEVDEGDQSQILNLTLGAATALTDNLQVFATVPWVRRSEAGRSNLGDVAVGGQYLLLESLFASDWYPTVSIVGGVKAPTGATSDLGRFLPGTGNGHWEPFAGLSFKKAVGPLNATLRFSYSRRWPHAGGDTLGDNFELTESVAYPFNPRFSLAAGSTQSWTLAQVRKGVEIEDSAARVVGAFIAPTYFFTRFWSVTASADFTVPLEGFGVNEPTSRAVTLTTRYGFY